MNAKKLNRLQEEAYQHIKPYLNKTEDLKKMCESCEGYCGEEHNYEECRNMQCFKFYLSHVYLNWDWSD
ncbi:hypothetical protein [Methanobrevibacter sp.]|uniref:hypothetical protein n=1 Tax=Methanobrevibacter sp. TaxID=66852 RepID=UPI00388E917C